MKLLNIGSMNLDYVYTMDHIILPGETESSYDLRVFPGGKGINQSVAIAKAGAAVYHCGLIGEDGGVFLDVCAKYGVNTQYIRLAEGHSGHTIIQIDRDAQNAILLYGGTNQMLSKDFIDEVLGNFEVGDLLLLQNEVNNLAYIVERAYEKGMVIALNPSPFNEKLADVDMKKMRLRA